jgi:putative MFS transporter
LVSIFFFDIIDLSSFSLVAPALMKEWGLSLEQVGLLTSTAFIGMFLGGFIGGRVADIIGRRPTVLLGVGIFSLASIASAFAEDALTLAAVRLVLGFGLQAATGAILVTVSESFPKAFRGRVMSLVLGVSLFGGPAIALVARVVVPAGQWHVVFLVGGLGLIPALFGLKYLPESPRWLAVRGQTERADTLLKAYESSAQRVFGSLPDPVVQHEVTPAKSSMFDIFRPQLIRRTAVAAGIFSCFILLNYGFNTWLPTILVQRGYPQEDALSFSTVLAFASIGGALLAGTFVDRIERKVTIAVGVVVMSVCYLLIGFVDSVPVLLVAGFVAIALSQTVAATMYAYVPEMFPTSVRGIGAGFGNGIGRVAGIFSGVIVAFVMTSTSVTGLFVYFAAVALLMAAIVAFGPRMGIRTPAQKLLDDRALDAVAVGSTNEHANNSDTTPEKGHQA